MKPWNKIKWQAASAKKARNLLDDFEKWMDEPCEKCGMRCWDCTCPKTASTPANETVYDTGHPNPMFVHHETHTDGSR